MSEEPKEQKAKASAAGAEPEAPVVFISYSHDSAEHGAWVLKMAERLVQAGVDVILDQWDLGLGDDLPKFMEKGVSEADRVLMVCTEPYVRKADEGKGGVGYEAMIVTGELVRDLGTNKFIPIVRQGAGTVVMPKSVSTRRYVNFSAGQDADKAFEGLVREIHETPKAQKPALGKNPYASGGAPVAAAVVTEVKIEDAESAYLGSCEVVRGGDFKAWRDLVRKVKEPLSGRLLEWRKKYDGPTSMDIKALPGMILDAAEIYSPLMAVALAGVESGNAKFSNQQAMLDEFLRPRDWNSAGWVVVGSIPEALVFVYQGLHGATCIEAGELSLAIGLSRARVSRAHHYEGGVLHKDHRFVGVPESFNHSFKAAWAFLTSMSEKWPWLRRIFGSDEEYRACLVAYYMALSIQELAGRIAAGQADSLESENLILDIPVGWLWMGVETQQAAYRRLVQSHDAVRRIWRSLGVGDRAMAAAWPTWVAQSVGWITRDNPWGYRGTPAHANLFEDVRPEETDGEGD